MKVQNFYHHLLNNQQQTMKVQNFYQRNNQQQAMKQETEAETAEMMQIMKQETEAVMMAEAETATEIKEGQKNLHFFILLFFAAL
jgi:hypothetical protein